MPKPDGDGADLAQWIAEIREVFAAEAPELLGLFDIYGAEALFGRRFVDADLRKLPPSARVLEVGAGSMLLSCQLVREGRDVTSLEPTASGFGHFERMRALILRHAHAQGCTPRLVESTAESFEVTGTFDYAFSINVMEHVDDVEQSIRRIAASLVPGGTYRFTCANYLFPYEPHFNIPTLFSKRLTERVLHAKIYGRQNIGDPAGLWKSLNWINVPGLRRIAQRLPAATMSFDTALLVSTLERTATDAQFAARRSPFMRRLMLWLVRSRLHRMLALAPADIQPIIDCRVVRR